MDQFLYAYGYSVMQVCLDRLLILLAAFMFQKKYKICPNNVTNNYRPRMWMLDDVIWNHIYQYTQTNNNIPISYIGI